MLCAFNSSKQYASILLHANIGSDFLCENLKYGFPVFILCSRADNFGRVKKVL